MENDKQRSYKALASRLNLEGKNRSMQSDEDTEPSTRRAAQLKSRRSMSLGGGLAPPRHRLSNGLGVQGPGSRSTPSHSPLGRQGARKSRSGVQLPSTRVGTPRKSPLGLQRLRSSSEILKPSRGSHHSGDIEASPSPLGPDIEEGKPASSPEKESTKEKVAAKGLQSEDSVASRLVRDAPSARPAHSDAVALTEYLSPPVCSPGGLLGETTWRRRR